MDKTNDPQLETSTGLVNTAIHDIGKVILGKQQQIKLALACLLAKGHCLIEALPGVGKTTLPHVMCGISDTG